MQMKDNLKITTTTKTTAYTNNSHKYILIMFLYMTGIANYLTESGFLKPN